MVLISFGLYFNIVENSLLKYLIWCAEHWIIRIKWSCGSLTIKKDNRADINEKDVIPAIFERFRDIVFHSLSRDCLTDISDMGPGILITKLYTSQRNGRLNF